MLKSRNLEVYVPKAIQSYQHSPEVCCSPSRLLQAPQEHSDSTTWIIWDGGINLNVTRVLMVPHPMMVDDITQHLYVDVKKKWRKYQALWHTTSDQPWIGPLTPYQH